MNLRKYIGHAPIIMCCAGVIILNKLNQILLQNRSDNDTWGVPGGALEPGESLEETARREVAEETGLNIDKMQLFGVYSGKEFFYTYPNGDQVYIIDHIFVAGDFAGTIKIDQNESKKIEFFRFDELPANIHPPNRMVLKDFLKQHIEKQQ